MESSLSVALIGLAGGIIAAAIGAWAALRARRPALADVELLDVSAYEGFSISGPLSVVDLKLRNRGGESAVLKRTIVDVLWSGKIDMIAGLEADSSGKISAVLPSSAVYHGDNDGAESPSLPLPGTGPARTMINISQVIAPGDADRFQVWLRRDRFSAGRSVYLLQLTVLYNADQRVSSHPLLVTRFQDVPYVPGPAELTTCVRRFQQDVALVRRRIDEELTSRGLPAPDWVASPPRAPSDLPRSGGFRPWGGPTSQFWDPQRAINGYLDDAERICNQIIEGFPRGLHNELDAAIAHAWKTREHLPALRE
jgi:hypothetical protein